MSSAKLISNFRVHGVPITHEIERYREWPVLCAGEEDVIAAASMEETVRREFEELFREHFQLVYCAAYSVTGSSQDAEDVIQTVFLKLRQQPLLLRIRDNPKPYLYRAAVNASLNIIRSRKRQELTGDVDRFDAVGEILPSLP
jgi:DNA-directed RNA polymerase specialized sigma24 family protein